MKILFRYRLDDQEFYRLIQLMEYNNQKLFNFAALEFIPLIRYLPLQWLPSYREARDSFVEERAFSQSNIDEHRRTYQEG